MDSLNKWKLSVIRVWQDPSRYGSVLRERKKKRLNRKYVPRWRIYAERMPASFGNFTIGQLKEMIAEIELFPDKEKFTFNWNGPHHEYFIVTIVKDNSENYEIDVPFEQRHPDDQKKLLEMQDGGDTGG